MRKTSLLILALILSGVNGFRSSATAQSVATAATSKSSDLVLTGTVTKTYPVAASRSLRRWAVVVRVARVVSGEFSGATFTFTIHSPARAGLRVGRTYTIKATPTGAGYVVDEFALKEVPAGKAPSSEGDRILRRAFEQRSRKLQVEGEGIVERILPDDNDRSRHQRFIVE